MDLLVELCSHYHLNPALHTLELLSPEGHTLGFKPNALLGSLNVACVLIKEKVWEEKVVRRPAPKVPEVSNSGARYCDLDVLFVMCALYFVFYTCHSLKLAEMRFDFDCRDI